MRDVDEINRITLEHCRPRVTNALFRTTPFFAEYRRHYQPPTWRDRLRWKVQRVSGYLYTIWRALRGDDLDTPRDDGDDYY